MPPNRKSDVDVIAVALSVEDIAVSHGANDVAKFPPLTSSETKTTASTPADEKQDAVISAVSIAQDPTASKNPEIIPINDGYRDEDIQNQEKEGSIIMAKHTMDPTHPLHSYWDYPTVLKEQEKENIISTVLEEEKIRQLLSVERLEKRLIQQYSEQRQKNDPPLCESAACFGDAAYFAGEPSYWDW